MSAESPRFPSPESPKDEKDTDGTSKKKKLRYFPGSAESTVGKSNTEVAARDKPKTLEDIIAEAKRRKAQSETEHVPDDAPEQKPTDAAETQTETAEIHDVESLEDENTEAENHEPGMPEETNLDTGHESGDDTIEQDEQIHWRELTPNELSVGEVVRLRDEDTTEGEVSLHETTEQHANSESSPGQVPEYPVWTPQVEQQHRAATDTNSPEAPANTTVTTPETQATEQNQPDPESIPEADPQPDAAVVAERRRQNDESSVVNETRPVAPVAGRNEQPATRREVEDALNRTAAVNGQRGLLTGLFAGTYFANRRLRRRQKKETKLLERQSRQLKQQATELRTFKQGQEQQRTKSERRLDSLERTNNANTAPKSEKSLERTENKSKQPPREVITASEQQLQVPENHRLERSAWHTIEVDKKTGKAVEDPSFQYGQEYYREKAHENTPADPRLALAGAAAVKAVSGSGQPGADSVPDASTQSRDPNHVGSKSQDFFGGMAQKFKNTARDGKSSAGPVWPWIVALVVIVILLSVLVR